MRISRKKPRFHTSFHRYKINEYIRAEEVRLIDEDGKNIGVIPTQQAIQMALEKDLDLVEVYPAAQPPVAKIVDFSKMRYEEDKQRRKEKAKQKSVEVKGIRLSIRIGQHDLETRVNQAKKFLEEGNRVKIELNLRGRERQHKDIARDTINKFIDLLNAEIEIKKEQDMKLQGSQYSAVIGKK